ncbi:MAG: efflux RND transporter permease subunit [Lachnospirales bacterium]
MNIIKLSVKRPVTTTMMILIVVVYGIMSYMNLNLDMLPNINVPMAVVSTTYSGAGSEEIENLITKPLESTLGTITGVEDIQSVSSYGSSVIMLTFEDNIDMDFAALDIRERVDMVKSYLPEDASEPMVLKIDMNQMSSIMIGVRSDTKGILELQSIVEDKVINRIERQAGVASADAAGGKEQEVSIQFDEQKMIGYGISEQTVIGLLAAENYTIPVGDVKQGNVNLPISVKGEFSNLVEIENLVIPTANGNIFLGDIATVEFIYKEQDAVSYMDGLPSLMISVSKQSTANSVAVSDALLAEIEKINAEMPDLELVMLVDPADYIRISLSNVSSSAIIGACLAVVVLLIFLNDIRASLVVGVAMPVSVIATFLLMHVSGMSLNMMSLGGLALGVGMLVDNSIVVIESIYRKLEEGYSKGNAAVFGAKEVAVPVIASTLTTVAVFLPITFAGGLTADIFNELSFTITFSLASSLVVALTFVPMASSLFLETIEEKAMRNSKGSRIINAFQRFFVKLERGYRSILDYALNHRKTIFAIVVAFIVFTGGVTAMFVKVTMIPEMDEGLVTISISLPEGTVIEDTEEKIDEFMLLVEDMPEIENTAVMLGSSGTISLTGSGSTNTGTIYLFLNDVTERDKTASQLANEISKLSKNIAGAEISASASSMSMGGFGGSTVDIQIYGDELDTLSSVVNDFIAAAEAIPDAGEVTSSIETASPQAEIIIDKEKATALGVNATAVSSSVRTAIEGSVATTYSTDGTEYDVRVSQGVGDFNFITDIENISIVSAYGTNIPLSEIAEIKIVDTPLAINRINQVRYETVSIALGDLQTNDIKAIMEEFSNSYIMPEGYYWEYSGTSEQMTEIFGSLGSALIAAVLIVYMIMAAQFESFKYPFIVMFSIPIALTGGLFGLIVTGEMFSMTSFMGLIMLSGIVINNAIVLIDYTNVLIREEGYSIKEALLKAGPVRLRPILMSALTTILGLVPMLVSNASGSEMMKGLSAVVVFGLAFSTLITLIFVPSVYIVVAEASERSKEKRYRKRATKLNISYEEYMEIIENTKKDRLTGGDTIEKETSEFNNIEK